MGTRFVATDCRGGAKDLYSIAHGSAAHLRTYAGIGVEEDVRFRIIVYARVSLFSVGVLV